MQILLEPSSAKDYRALGVELVSNGDKFTVQGVKNDIIVSAGTFQTPQVLELSGIGNKKILENHGIKALIDLPGVGENLRKYAPDVW